MPKALAGRVVGAFFRRSHLLLLGHLGLAVYLRLVSPCFLIIIEAALRPLFLPQMPFSKLPPTLSFSSQ